MHTSINDYDLAAITNQVNEWKKHNKYGDYDISGKASGVVGLALENIAAGDGSIMIFEIHKVSKKGFLRKKQAGSCSYTLSLPPIVSQQDMDAFAAPLLLGQSIGRI